ncbi:Acid phosphatase [Aphelenchoides besseyi]|nr:Acid phosphatase [Aphelenchoides besseyi]
MDWLLGLVFLVFCLRLIESDSEFRSTSDFVQSIKPPPLFRTKRLAPLYEFEDTEDELVFVQSLFRHGDRTPESPFYYDKPNQWPGLAEVTVKGMEQMVVLGKKLRTKYVETLKFISHYYNPKEVYFRSSNRNRTLQSALAKIVGFVKGRRGIEYPDMEEWPEDYVPVPVHTIDYYTDSVFNQYIKCEKAEQARELLMKAPEYQLLKRKTARLLQHLSKLRNQTITLENSYFFYDIWHIHRLNNVPMPPGFTDELYEQFEALSFVMHDYQFGVGIRTFRGMDLRRELTRLRGGSILGELIGNMEMKVECANDSKNKKSCQWIRDLKYYAYSGHDTTIEVLFSAFGFENTNYVDVGEPKYAACLTFELWKSKNGYYVKVLYWPPQMGTFDITADIVGCDEEKCPLRRFVDRSQAMMVDDFEEECKLPSGYDFSGDF